MNIFDECIQAAGTGAKVLSQNQTISIFKNLNQKYPFTEWGKIDWEKVQNKLKMNSFLEVFTYIDKYYNEDEKDVTILWDNSDYPAINATLEKTMSIIDDVLAVSFNTWLYNTKCKYVIEFSHDGDIVLGESNREQ